MSLVLCELQYDLLGSYDASAYGVVFHDYIAWLPKVRLYSSGILQPFTFWDSRNIMHQKYRLDVLSERAPTRHASNHVVWGTDGVCLHACLLTRLACMQPHLRKLAPLIAASRSMCY